MLLSDLQKVKILKSLSVPNVLGQSVTVNQSTLFLGHHNELALLVVSPTLLYNSEFVYIIDDLHRQKFNLCAIRRL